MAILGRTYDLLLSDELGEQNCVLADRHWCLTIQCVLLCLFKSLLIWHRLEYLQSCNDINDKVRLKCIKLRLLRWMALICLEELSWRLPIIVALTLIGCLQNWVIDETDIEIAFFLRCICDLAELIQRHDSFLVTLLASKDVVNPCVQVV